MDNEKEVKRSVDRIVNAIENEIRTYHLQHQKTDNGEGLSLTDALTPEIDDNISRGLEEVDLLVDSVCGEAERMIAKALSAERERAEKAEKRIDGKSHALFEQQSYTAELQAKITALEAKVKELDEWKSSAMKIMNSLDFHSIGKEINAQLGSSIAPQILPYIIALKEQLDTANAKIVELEVINNRLNNEASDMSIVMDSNLNRYNEIISIEKKKAEKLVENLKELCNAVGTMNFGKNYAVRVKDDDEPVYQQRHEWCAWIFELKSRAEQALKEFRGGE